MLFVNVGIYILYFLILMVKEADFRLFITISRLNFNFKFVNESKTKYLLINKIRFKLNTLLCFRLMVIYLNENTCIQYKCLPCLLIHILINVRSVLDLKWLVSIIVKHIFKYTFSRELCLT